ncbi:uncharacterized protein UV8b_07102 [Ustilaginoidea virens]|uniref:WSC domain-containing protein n=1 Tax=Ustilaginoidea virens TaxID=1159556 RepID=A0A8E5MK94_USTVR|nr:uncharacterized protein UV8b_07102 [Ustilaginoidea virens]QUC22861.1 hypothetical protein UV8b_07102 [Ustilaginoidea virens]
MPKYAVYHVRDLRHYSTGQYCTGASKYRGPYKQFIDNGPNRSVRASSPGDQLQALWRFFGVYNEDCYCGDNLDATAVNVVLDQCDISCPGNTYECCGGKLNARRSSSLLRRQLNASDILLSLFERISGSGSLPGGQTTTDAAPSRYITLTQALTGTNTAPTTVTIAPSGTVPGSIIIQTPLTPAGFITITLPLTGSGSVPVTVAIPPSGTIPGTVLIQTPPATGQYITITQPLTGTISVPVTITIPPRGTVPGTIIIQTPAATGPYITLTQPLTGTNNVPTTVTIPPRGTVPGTIIIQTTPGAVPYVTLTQLVTGTNVAPATITIPGSGTVPGSVIIQTPAVASYITLTQPLPGIYSVPTTITRIHCDVYKHDYSAKCHKPEQRVSNWALCDNHAGI